MISYLYEDVSYMGFLFESIRILDVIDILLVAFLLYQIYLLIRGTVAINIFYGIFILYLAWLLVKALNMRLLGSILGQFIGLGLIALLIVFQQEIRRFLLVLGTQYFSRSKFKINTLLGFSNSRNEPEWDFEPLIRAITRLSKTKTGAIIALAKESRLRAFADTGVYLDAALSSELLETIFMKDTPLHDGAVILTKNRILAAGCVLPITESTAIPARMGMRHRAAVGMSEQSDSFVLVVSEETGRIAYANQGQLTDKVKPEELRKILSALFREIQS